MKDKNFYESDFHFCFLNKHNLSKKILFKSLSSGIFQNVESSGGQGQRATDPIETNRSATYLTLWH